MDGLVIGLVDRVIDETVGSRFTAVLHSDSQLCRGQVLMNAINIHTKCVGFWGEKQGA